MKDYKKLFKISMVLTSIGIFFMTMMIFIILVYTKDKDDVMKDPFSRVFLRWPMWFIGMMVCYIPGISGLVIANKRKAEAMEEALKIK
jgi:hypothetical protein